MNPKIQIIIDGEPLLFTVEEARELYESLKKVFGNGYYTTSPAFPFELPYRVTCKNEP